MQSHIDVSNKFVKYTAVQFQQDIDQIFVNLWQDITSDKAFKNPTKLSTDPSLLETKLNEHFNRRYHTSGLISLLKIRLLDTDYNVIASSTMGEVSKNSLDTKLKDLASKREGAERLKLFNGYWSHNRQLYYSALMPLGGFRVRGYLEVIVDPIFNLKQLESPLESPIQIELMDSTKVFQSDSWVEQSGVDTIAETTLGDDSTKFRLLVSFNDEKLNNQINLLMAVSAAIFVAFFCGIAFVLYRILKKTLFQPMDEMVKELNSAAELDLTTEIDDFGVEEVSKVSVSLDNFLKSLREQIGEIVSVCSIFVTTSEEVMELSGQNKQGIEDQNRHVDKLVSINKSLQSGMKEIENITDDSVKTSANTANVATQGKQTVHSAVDSIKVLAQHFESSQPVIQSFSDESQTITSVVDVIVQISEQTNLLALNAAIEALEPGEAGRGFSVVADEVRALATRTQESAVSIRDIVNSLKEKSDQVVHTMEKNQSLAQGAVISVEEAGEAFDTVEDNISAIVEKSRLTQSTTEKQGTLSRELEEGVVAVNEISTMNMHFSDLNAENGKSLFEIARELQAAVERFKLSDQVQLSAESIDADDEPEVELFLAIITTPLPQTLFEIRHVNAETLMH